MLMSPLRTFHSWGSSSRLVLRRILPTRVMRGSFLILNTGPVISFFASSDSSSLSALGCIVLNL